MIFIFVFYFLRSVDFIFFATVYALYLSGILSICSLLLTELPLGHRS